MYDDWIMGEPLLVCDGCLRSEIDLILKEGCSGILLKIDYNSIDEVWLCEDCAGEELTRRGN